MEIELQEDLLFMCIIIIMLIKTVQTEILLQKIGFTTQIQMFVTENTILLMLIILLILMKLVI